MRRREFITLIVSSVTVSWPSVLRAQQTKVARVGALYSSISGLPTKNPSSASFGGEWPSRVMSRAVT
jgi:hypothetical protein